MCRLTKWNSGAFLFVALIFFVSFFYQEKIENMRKQHAQDYADQEARFEARFANQEARFEAKLSKLFPHAAQEEAGASASYSHTSENSTHFFTRPSN